MAENNDKSDVLDPPIVEEPELGPSIQEGPREISDAELGFSTIRIRNVWNRINPWEEIRIDLSQLSGPVKAGDQIPGRGRLNIFTPEQAEDVNRDLKIWKETEASSAESREHRASLVEDRRENEGKGFSYTDIPAPFTPTMSTVPSSSISTQPKTRVPGASQENVRAVQQSIQSFLNDTFGRVPWIGEGLAFTLGLTPRVVTGVIGKTLDVADIVTPAFEAGEAARKAALEDNKTPFEANRAAIAAFRDAIAGEGRTPSTSGGNVPPPKGGTLTGAPTNVVPSGGGGGFQLADWATNQEALRRKLGEHIKETSHRDRAPEAREELLESSGIDTTKTPEMQRTEYFQRLADIENNRLFWRPSVNAWVPGMGVQELQQGEAYQFPQLEFEDMRQQVINRARHGDKLAYQEWERMKEANEVLYKIMELGELNINDLEKLIMVNDEALRQMMGISEVQLRADMRMLDSNVEARRALNMAQTAMGIDQMKVAMLLGYMADHDYTTATMMSQLMGMGFPGWLATLLGDTAFSMLRSNYRAASQRMNRSMISTPAHQYRPAGQ